MTTEKSVNSEMAMDYFGGDYQHDAVDVMAALKRPAPNGMTEIKVRSTLIYAIKEMREKTGDLTPPHITPESTDLEYLVCDYDTEEMHKRLRRYGIDISHFYLKASKI